MTSSRSYGQFQVVHDAPNTTTILEIQPLILGDGSIVTHHFNSGMHILRKYDQTGSLIWNKGFPGEISIGWTPELRYSMTTYGEDGLVFIHYSDYAETEIDPDPPYDYLIEEFFNVVILSGTGDIINSFTIKKSYVEDISPPILLDVLDIIELSDGGLLVMISFDLNDNPGAKCIELLKVNANGIIVWSRSLGQSNSNQAFTPTRTFDAYGAAKIAVDPDGSIYYTEAGGVFVYHFRLAKLDTNGDLLWMKRYVYGNTVSGVSYDDVILDQNGDIHTAGRLQTTVGIFHIFLRTSSDGDLQRADIYRDPYGFANGQFGIDDQGRRFHNVKINNGNTTTQAILKADTLGSPAQYLRRDDQVVLPNNVFIPFQSFDVRGDRAALTGLLHHEHVDLAYTTRYETLLSFDTDDLFSCITSDTTFEHIEVPLEMITTEPVNSALSLDMMQYYSIVPSTLSFGDLPMEQLDTLCTFAYELLGIQVDTDEIIGLGELPLVRQTLLTSGVPLILNDVGASYLEVWSTSGSLIHQMNIQGSASLPTHGWTSGMYLVKALDQTGNSIRTERFLIH